MKKTRKSIESQACSDKCFSSRLFFFPWELLSAPPKEVNEASDIQFEFQVVFDFFVKRL